jgi:hypothetical protein
LTARRPPSSSRTSWIDYQRTA